MKKFKPESPDKYIKTPADMTLARFGHLNAIVAKISQFGESQSVAGGLVTAPSGLIVGFNLVTPVGLTNSVILPSLAAFCACDGCGGLTGEVTVKNNGLINLNVYPLSTESVDGGALGTPFVLEPGASVSFTDMDCTSWESFANATDPSMTGVNSVTGCLVDNTDPANPIVLDIETDGITITGTGCPGDPLIAVQQPVDGVQGITGCLVDNTDPANPIINDINVAVVSATEALTGDGCTTPLSVCIDGTTITKDLNGCLQAVAPPASSSDYGMFYGLTAGTGSAGTDYAATVAPGAAVPFPQDGPSAGIVRASVSSFTLANIGTYEVNFKVHTTEPGQLQVRLNGVVLPETTSVNMNPTAGGHPIVGTGIFVRTTTINEVLEIIVPAGNTPALTITPADGASTHANAQSVSIKQIA